ncbi:hypothetical protein KC19_VG318200 [Ceratodon purpureus]|uniref:Uncharacterized protein n=1 Tax=Ceratodon purpureus TaxID=3225 RepID=A0A8T0HXJ3_CERPU|nr:hypothetical protein KC19_VG318200 [Ceratodon purpureus]
MLELLKLAYNVCHSLKQLLVSNSKHTINTISAMHKSPNIYDRHHIQRWKDTNLSSM